MIVPGGMGRPADLADEERRRQAHERWVAKIHATTSDAPIDAPPDLAAEDERKTAPNNAGSHVRVHDPSAGAFRPEERSLWEAANTPRLPGESFFDWWRRRANEIDRTNAHPLFKIVAGGTGADPKD